MENIIYYLSKRNNYHIEGRKKTGIEMTPWKREPEARKLKAINTRMKEQKQLEVFIIKYIW